MDVETFKTRQQRTRDEVQADMVNFLHGLLQRVERGEVTGIAIATAELNRDPGYYWRGWNRAALSESLSGLQHRYFKEVTKG